MTHSDYMLEVSILSTILFAHHQIKDEPFFNNIELQEEDFEHQFHKLVVKQINHNRAESIPIYEEYITDAMLLNGTFNADLIIKIMEANPFSRVLFEQYYNTFKQPNKSLSCGI